MIKEPNCRKRMCIHFIGVSQPDGTELSECVICKAFPNGIPREIAYGSNDHTTPYPGDNGIMFTEPPVGHDILPTSKNALTHAVNYYKNLGTNLIGLCLAARDGIKKLHGVDEPEKGLSQEIAKVVFTFNKRNEPISLVIDNTPKTLSGRFSNGKTLLLVLWNSPNHTLEKKAFDKRHPNIRNRGKSELKDLIGPQIFASVYRDNGRNDPHISLSNAIEVRMLQE